VGGGCITRSDQVAWTHGVWMATSMLSCVRVRKCSGSSFGCKSNVSSHPWFVIMTRWWRMDVWWPFGQFETRRFLRRASASNSVCSEYWRWAFRRLMTVFVLGTWKQVSCWLSGVMLVPRKKLSFTNICVSLCGVADVTSVRYNSAAPRGTRLVHCGRSLLRSCGVCLSRL